MFPPKGTILSAGDDRQSGGEVRDGHHLGVDGTCSWLSLTIAALASSGFYRMPSYLSMNSLFRCLHVVERPLLLETEEYEANTHLRIMPRGASLIPMGSLCRGPSVPSLVTEECTSIFLVDKVASTSKSLPVFLSLGWMSKGLWSLPSVY